MFRFKQIFDKASSTYTYILWDKETKEGILIDSVLENIERDQLFLKEMGITLKYFIETHVHADHLTGIYKFIEKYPNAKCIYGKDSGVDTKIVKNVQLIAEGETIKFGKNGRLEIEAIATPGHTNGCTTYYFPGKKYGGCSDYLFTGDAVFVRACGRTDFQGGSNKLLFNSIAKLYKRFDDETVIYPGHDYKGYLSTTIGEEKKFSKRLKEGQSLEQFESSMNEVLKTLPLPQKIYFAVPANLNGGIGAPNLMHQFDGKKLFALANLNEEAFRLGVSKFGISNFFHLSTSEKEKEFYTKLAQELNVVYVHLPFTPESITGEKLEMFGKMVDNAKGNVSTCCFTENKSRFMYYYYLKKRNANANYEEILKFMHGPVMISYLKKLDDKNFKMDVGDYFKKMAGASVSDVCTSTPAQAKHSECGM